MLRSSVALAAAGTLAKPFIIAAASADAAAPPTAASAPTGELRITLGALGALDPVLGDEDMIVLPAQYDFLIGVKPDGTLSQDTGVARSWKFSPDGMVLTLEVRPGIKFHNGDPLTAEDVKFSLEQFMSPRSTSVNANYLRSVIKDIQVPDPTTAIIELKKRSPVLPYYFSQTQHQEGVVLPKKYMTEKGLDGFNASPVGSGPYRFVSSAAGVDLKLEAVDRHWLVGVPRWKNLTVLAVKEESTALAMLKTGQVDIINVGRDKLAQVKDYKIYTKPGADTWGFYLNNQDNPSTYLGHKEFREALSIAINRQEIKDYIFEGQFTVAASASCYGSYALDYKDPPPIPYDPKRAKELVDQTVAKFFPGKTPSIDLYYMTDEQVPEAKRTSEAIAGYWEKIGVKTRVIPTDYTTYRAAYVKKGPQTNNAVGLHRLGNRLLWGGCLDFIFYSKGAMAVANDPKMDALIDALNAETDPAKVGQRMYDAALYIHDQHLAIPLGELSMIYAADPRKVPEWPGLNNKLAYKVWVEGLYTRR